MFLDRVKNLWCPPGGCNIILSLYTVIVFFFVWPFTWLHVNIARACVCERDSSRRVCVFEQEGPLDFCVLVCGCVWVWGREREWQGKWAWFRIISLTILSPDLPMWLLNHTKGVLRGMARFLYQFQVKRQRDSNSFIMFSWHHGYLTRAEAHARTSGRPCGSQLFTNSFN